MPKKFYKITLWYNGIQQNDVQLIIHCRYALCHDNCDDNCHYAECHCAECCSVTSTGQFFSSIF